MPEPGAVKPFASTPLSPIRSDASPHPDSDPEPVDLHPCNSDRPPVLQTSIPETPAHSSGAVKDVTSRYPYLPEQLCAVAVAADWQHLAQLIKNTDYHHCVLCGQWLAHPGCLSGMSKHNMQRPLCSTARCSSGSRVERPPSLAPASSVAQTLRCASAAGPDMHVSAQSCIVQAFSSGCALLTLCLQLSALPRPFMSMTALQVMESHMKDALRQEIQDVTSQEILAAADQANLLSAMMCRSAGALDKPAPSNPGQGSTGPSTPSAPPREAEVATTPGPEPEPMETQRDKRAAESANPAGKGNGDQEKWPKPFAKGNARTSDDGWQRDHSQASNRRRGAQDHAWTGRTVRSARIATGGATRTMTATRTRPS